MTRRAGTEPLRDPPGPLPPLRHVPGRRATKGACQANLPVRRPSTRVWSGSWLWSSASRVQAIASRGRLGVDLEAESIQRGIARQLSARRPPKTAEESWQSRTSPAVSRPPSLDTRTSTGSTNRTAHADAAFRTPNIAPTGSCLNRDPQAGAASYQLTIASATRSSAGPDPRPGSPQRAEERGEPTNGRWAWEEGAIRDQGSRGPVAPVPRYSTPRDTARSKAAMYHPGRSRSRVR